MRRLFMDFNDPATSARQPELDLRGTVADVEKVSLPHLNIVRFLDFLSSLTPTGDVYLFGGVLRDMALFGKRGFNSDIDVVVEGGWQACSHFLSRHHAKKNKFGGYRITVGEWPVDIWNAEETWAIRQGYVQYDGVASLLKTTILNWDAILMNWRTKVFISSKTYLDNLRGGVMDIVLDKNPNPLGMYVRILRHMYCKDATKVSSSVLKYLYDNSIYYSYAQVSASEGRSYDRSVITEPFYEYFSSSSVALLEFLENENGVRSMIMEKEFDFVVR